MNTPLLQLQHVHFQRGRRRILQDVHFSLYPGEIVVFMGANGAGKTTLLELILGSKGIAAGQLKHHIPRHQLAYLPDKAPLYPALSVQEFLHFCRRLRGIQDPEALPRVLQLCQLESVRHQLCAELSHGYRQRLALAQALLQRPRVLLLDELSNGLDGQQKRSLRQLLRDIRAESSIILSSHDEEEAAAVADRVFYLRRGQLLEISLPPERQRYFWFKIHPLKQAELRQSLPQALWDGDFLARLPEQKNDFLREQAAAVEALSWGYPGAALRAQLPEEAA